MPTGRSKDRLSKAEIRKDALQESVTAASHAVGSVATIVTTAVGDVARTLGGFATELFEIRDSVRRAGRDHGVHEDDQLHQDQPAHPDVVVTAEQVEPVPPTDPTED